MRKKLTPELLEQMLQEYFIRQRIAEIDLGVHYPLRSADGENPFTIAKANPERPVSFVIDAPQPLHGTVEWKPSAPPTVHSTRLQTSDFWLEPEISLPTLAGQGAPEEDRSELSPEPEETAEVDPLELGGEFRVKLDDQDRELLSLKISSPNSDQPAFAATHHDDRIDPYDLPSHQKLVDPNASIQAKVRNKKNGKKGDRERLSSKTNANAEEPPSEIFRPQNTKDTIRPQLESDRDVIADSYAKHSLFERRWRDLQCDVILDFDAHVIADCYAKHYDYLCWSIGGTLGPEIGREALQLAMIRILSKLESIDTLPNAIAQYICGKPQWLRNMIIQNGRRRKIEILRKKSNQSIPSLDATMPGQNDETTFASVLEADEPTTLHDLINMEDMQSIHDAIAQLKDNYRSAITLLYFEGLSYEECAAVLEVPLTTFQNWPSRAIEQLREILSNHFE
jgi:RNA polymerase sigma factor (sigma-70 family)